MSRQDARLSAGLQGSVIGPAQYPGRMPSPNAKDSQTANIGVFWPRMSQYPISRPNSYIQTLPRRALQVSMFMAG
jgi:hypothetical protein